MKTAHAAENVHGTVWQDKRAFPRARPASRQPARIPTPLHADRVSTLHSQSQNPCNATVPRVQLPLHVKPIVKAEVQRLAEINGLSASAQGADLLEEILRQKLHIQQAATLESAMEKSLAKAHRSLATKLAFFLVRIAFDVGHIKVLSTNTLGMQEGMTEELLKDIFVSADTRTRANLMRKTPQLTELMKTVEQWLVEGGKEAAPT